MKIYLDTNIYFRPLDDRCQPRIALEVEACLSVLEALENKNITIIGFDILLYEIRQADKFRQTYVLPFVKFWHKKVKINTQTIQLAKNLKNKLRIKSYDSLHLALAIEEKADYFLTCDDKFINRTRELTKIKTINPIDFIKKGLI